MKNFKQFDVFFGYLNFKDLSGGKERPSILIDIDKEDNSYITFGIYSYRKYFEEECNKSKFIEILDLEQAGLNKRSFVDVSTEILVDYVDFEKFTYIGHLSKRDISNILNNL